MTESFARLKRITTREELNRIACLAARDHHLLLAPSHAVIKGLDIVGHFSICNIPIMFAHLGMDEIKSRDSFNLVHVGEQIVELTGHRFVVCPISRNSPFHPIMPEMGYQEVMDVTLFKKDFTA